MTIECRFNGKPGRTVFLLHGGPGAPGSLAPLAEGLKERFFTVEPFQRKSGACPLTVARHVEDFHELVLEACKGEPSVVVGHSWGAMLALAVAAAHPEDILSLVLVGCGTFDRLSRARMDETLSQRMDDESRRKVLAIKESKSSAGERMRSLANLLLPFYSFDPLMPEETSGFDPQAYGETWEDMLRLQEEGFYPSAFSAIRCPVLMLHGSWDPHPGRMIKDSLAPHIPQITFVELEECGHVPWIERKARERFFSLLLEWLESGLPRPGTGKTIPRGGPS